LIITTRDDEVDQLYNQIFRELISYMIEDPGTVTRAMYLLFCAHNVERIADRVTNICERVTFVATGRLEEIPSKAGTEVGV
jgi:phosphate transport system protein